ncbi:MAG TPA: hypothetical protein VHY22_03660 [Chthoniobacteraceae bacterium]|jgi:hypothetical protein|nr:hypothetical protein [Chthoniobacteraceae bacterium]
MAIPLRIHGPAVIQFNGVTYYFKTGLKGSIKRRRAKIEVDAFGQIAEVARDCVVEFTGTPAGSIRAADLAGQMPYTPSMVGQSLFGTEDAPLVVQTINDGATITWTRGAISKYAPILLSATHGTLYKGDMTFACLMASDYNLAGATAWKTITATAFADTTFDPTKVRMSQFVGSWGSTAPYNSLISEDGFLLTPAIVTEPISVDNYGIIDIALKSITGTAQFKPANLTEAQIDSLVALQGSGAFLPGSAIGQGGNDLVITSNLLVATLKQAGAVDYELLYATGKLRPGEVAFGAATTFTNGVPNPVITFSIPS